MRNIAIAMVVLVVGCGGGDDGGGGQTCRYQDHDYAIGETWPAGDGCNDCSCAAEGFICTLRPCSAPPDASPTTLCQPTGTCTTGPGCGSVCCARGERCELGVCHCGAGAACGVGDTCEAAGPIGGDACGGICCGASGPCPQ